MIKDVGVFEILLNVIDPRYIVFVPLEDLEAVTHEIYFDVS